MIKKPILITLGIICVILGIIGAVLPVMPTTPFAILAAYFFSKSSPKMHHWILNLKYIGPSIQEWEKHHVIRPRAKVMCLVTIFAMFGSTLLFVRTYMWAKIAMACVGIAVSTFVVTRKSYPDVEENTKDEDGQEASHNFDVNSDQRLGGG
jgi:uncharacterized membrane protein YbaN (DUF454 family)